MLEGDPIHDPLLIYFIAITRQPFLISGFLDTGEFVLLKDFAAREALGLKRFGTGTKAPVVARFPVGRSEKRACDRGSCPCVTNFVVLLSFNAILDGT